MNENGKIDDVARIKRNIFINSNEMNWIPVVHVFNNKRSCWYSPSINNDSRYEYILCYIKKKGLRGFVFNNEPNILGLF